MKSKKLIIAVVALTMSATSALAFSACHKHEYKWETTTEATCTTEGEKTGTCDCGNTKTEVIPKSDHSYGGWTVKKPTESAKGEAVKSCATDSEHTHDIKVELPELGDEAYTVTEGDDVDTYTLANSNGDITFTVEKVKPIVTKVTVADADYDSENEFYFKEISFTVSKAGIYTLSLTSSPENAYVEVYTSKEDWLDWAPAVLENANDSADLECEAGTEYKYVLLTDAKGDYTFNVETKKPVKYAAAVKGENTATLAASMREDVNNLFVFEGTPSTKYVLSYAAGTQNSPIMYGIKYIDEYTYDLSGDGSGFETDNYLIITTNASGKAYFSLVAFEEGEYSFTISDYVNVPVAAIEFKDDQGNDLTEYTLYLGASNSDYALASKFTVLPNNASNKSLQFEIEDKTVASYEYAFVGLKEGTTKLTVKANAGTADEVTKVITLKVTEKVNSLNVGDNVFDWDNDNGSLPSSPEKFRFTGTANTKYVVTFEKTMGYAWTIKDASDETNYIDMHDTVLTYLEVTTDADGKANLLINGTQATGTLSIVLASEFDYPAPPTPGGDDSKTDIDGRYKVKEGKNEGITIEYNSNKFSYVKYFVFEGEANTDYTVAVSEVLHTFGQCNASGDWTDETKVSNDPTGEAKTCIITTDANGIAYMRLRAKAEVTALTIDITMGKVDEHGYSFLKAGDNTGVEIKHDGVSGQRVFAFKGEANYNYTVTLSDIVSYFGQYDPEKNDFVDGKRVSNVDSGTYELNGTNKVCSITTDANGVSYLRINVNNTKTLSINIVKGEAAAPVGESIDLNVTVTMDDFDGSYLSVDVKYTPTVTGVYKFKLSSSKASIFISRTAYDGGWGDPINGECELTAGTEYTFVFSIGFSSDAVGDYTVTLTPPASTPDTPDPDPTPETPAADMTATGSATVTITDNAPYDNEEESSYFRTFKFTPNETGTYTITLTSEVDNSRIPYDVFTKECFDNYYDSSYQGNDFSSFINMSTGRSADIELTADTEYTFVIVVYTEGDHTLSAVKKAAE